MDWIVSLHSLHFYLLVPTQQVLAVLYQCRKDPHVTETEIIILQHSYGMSELNETKIISDGCDSQHHTLPALPN